LVDCNLYEKPEKEYISKLGDVNTSIMNEVIIKSEKSFDISKNLMGISTNKKYTEIL